MGADDLYIKQTNKTILFAGGFFLLVIIIMVVVGFFQHSSGKFPFDDYKRNVGKDSKLTYVIPPSAPKDLTPEQIETRDNMAK